MIVYIKKLAISELIANFISLLWIESRLHRLTTGHDGCGLTQICASELKKPAAQVSEVLWLNMNVQSVQELTDRGSSQSGSWSLPLHSSLLRLFTLSSSSSRQSAEAQTGFSVPDSTLGSPPAGPVFKEGKIAPCWRNLNVAFFVSVLICPQPESLLKEIIQHQEVLSCTLNASWFIYQSGGSKLWNIKTWFSRPS